MPHLSRYHTLHVAMREMRIWPPDAAKCCKNAGKFFPDVAAMLTFHSLLKDPNFKKQLTLVIVNEAYLITH